MKILHVISSLEVGGAQKLVSDLLPMFSSRGLEVELLVFQDVENNLSAKIKEAGIETDLVSPKLLPKYTRN